MNVEPPVELDNKAPGVGNVSLVVHQREVRGFWAEPPNELLVVVARPFLELLHAAP